ncbi:uncharacterized protein [Onthophagus taurus]|uniref:uncharacterized protein n=1 Tax=Onthophagus taurus TaxID=166361 RepID=UPI0039BEAF7E
MSKKLSGYQNRKRKATKELELEKQRDDIKKYLMTKNEVLPVPSNENLREDQLPASQSHSAGKSAQHTKSPEPEIEPQGASSEETLSTSTKFLITDDTPTLDVLNNLQDPATWPLINEKVRKLLIQLGPTKKQNVLYPPDDNGRKFSDTYYYRKMPNSESVLRDWLMYSEKSNSNLERALKSKRTIDQQQEKLFELEKQHWRAILERFIEIIKYLCKQCLPLRRKSDQLFVRNNGNFLQLVQLLAKFDVTMSSHLQKTLQKNELIALLAKKIKEKILLLIQKAKYFSIVLDCTPDISNTEQMTIIIRFVSTDDQVQIQEHFLGFIDIKDSTGEGLTNYIIEKIKELNLDISNLRGQGYDNDTTINSLEERCEQLTVHNNYFNSLHNLGNLPNLNTTDLKKHCDDLELYLTDGKDKDIISTELFNELLCFKDIFLTELNSINTPFSALRYSYKNNLEKLYVNLSIALRVLLTQPVTVSSGERSFSRLKIIKTYLRSTLSQERLVGLALIAIESDVCDQIDNNEIIENFASAKARRVNV